MSSQQIQQALEARFGNDKYLVPNCYFFSWESDFLVVKQSGYIYEIEIKISRSDFFADFNKVFKHRALVTGIETSKTGVPYSDIDTHKAHVDLTSEAFYLTEHKRLRPNKFFYACPQGLLRSEEIPNYAGLMYLSDLGTMDIIKPAPWLHRDKIEVEKRLCNKFYRYWKSANYENKKL